MGLLWAYTSAHGLKIHHGWKKYLKISNPGSGIEQILSRGRSIQSDDTQWQEETHSPQSVVRPTGTQWDEEEVSGTSNSPRPNQSQ